MRCVLSLFVPYSVVSRKGREADPESDFQVCPIDKEVRYEAYATFCYCKYCATPVQNQYGPSPIARTFPCRFSSSNPKENVDEDETGSL
jgi:hypothetical protein